MAIIIGLIVILFNTALTTIVNTSCSHGTTCPMYGTIRTQTYISVALIAIIVVIGLILLFSKEEKQVIVKKVKERIVDKNFKIKEENLKLLDSDEKKLYQLLLENKGTIFQSELVEKSGFDKVKVTRILDKLEGKQVIQRMRRGMTNVVLIKN